MLPLQCSLEHLNYGMIFVFQKQSDPDVTIQPLVYFFKNIKTAYIIVSISWHMSINSSMISVLKDNRISNKK